MLDLRSERGLLHLYADGLLTTRDYIDFAPAFERLERSEPKPIAILIELGPSFTGWSLGALWRDVQVDVAHRETFGRIAVVGDAKWEEWLAATSDLMFAAQVRFFVRSSKGEAEQWLSGGNLGDDRRT